MNPEIFREYDVRGIVGKDITDEDVVLIGSRRAGLPVELRSLQRAFGGRPPCHRL